MRRHIWRKVHLAVDAQTHEIICADLSLNNVTDAEAFPAFIQQTYWKIKSAVADWVYDIQLCHDELRRKKSAHLSLSGKVQVTGQANMQTETVLWRIND